MMDSRKNMRYVFNDKYNNSVFVFCARHLIYWGNLTGILKMLKCENKIIKCDTDKK